MSLPERTPQLAGSDVPAAVPAEAADAEVLSQVIADAFHDLAPSRWLVPDPDARREIFPGYFRLSVHARSGRGRCPYHRRPLRGRAVVSRRRGHRSPARRLR